MRLIRPLPAIVASSLVAAAMSQEVPEPRPVEAIRLEAARVAPLVSSPVARRFLAATADLPEIDQERVVWWNRAERRALRPEQAATMTEDQLAGFEQRRYGERFYYYTGYGSPLAYARAIDLAAEHGFDDADGRRVLDFGFGGIGQLRLLASLGAQVTGVEVLELLRDFYREPGDTGVIPRSQAAGPGAAGTLTLHYGHFPGDTGLRDEVGGGYDLILSKNVLKLGYVHPQREVDPRYLVDLGVDDAAFLGAMHSALAPGGLLVIYNLYPPQNPPDEPYLPHATGECPFERALIETAGFEVVVLDRDDTAAARRLGDALGWSQDMDLDRDLLAMYTVLRRPAS